MSRIHHRETSATAGLARLAGSVDALTLGASIETSTRNLAEIDAYAALLPTGTDVYATWLPGVPWHHIVAVAKRLRRAGINPVPHIVARRLADSATARQFLASLRAEAGVTRALLIGGDGEQIGPYASSAELLETGLLQAHGIRSVGVSGYPEGHPAIADAALQAALDRKIGYANRHGLDLFIVSQFCFDGATIIDWLRRLRGRGVALPVRVGVAGPCSVQTLMNYAVRCGVGNSIRALGSLPFSLPRLLAWHGPENVVRRVAQSAAALNISGLHYFPFGGFAQTARWIDNVALGKSQPDGSDESLDRRA